MSKSKHSPKAKPSRAKPCNTCHRPSSLPMCADCGEELKALLIGRTGERSEPGIRWYINRLMEQAYGQSQLGAIDSSHSSDYGYALLIDDRATDVLTKIRVVLGDWVAILDGLSATWSDERGVRGIGQRPGHSDPLEARYAAWLANRVKDIRRQQDSHLLFNMLLALSRDAWRIINRPADYCCGPCTKKLGKDEEPCGTMLYADSENARNVKCPRCKTRYDVDELRDAMKEKLRDMLFTGAELRRLMETRLNDRIPKATFYKLIADGRLAPRTIDVDTRTAYFTYADVIEAREKPCPTRKLSKSRRQKSA